MLHLVCLHCGRSNAAAAKFCVDCGAGLLRKFCQSCHATNDAESRFCQACGSALPAGPQPAPSAAAPVGPPESVPDLTDVVSVGGLGPAPLLAGMGGGGAVVEVPAPGLQLSLPAKLTARGASLRQYRLVLIAGIGALCAAVLAFWSWPRDETNSTALREPGPGGVANVMAPRGGVAVDSAATAALEAAGRVLSSPVEATAGAAPPERAAETTAIKAGRDPRAAVAALRRDGNGSPGAGAKTPASAVAVTTATAAPVNRPATPRPARPRTGDESPARECTPAIDALALCAPGATVVGR